jgi:hypothetical protein
MMSHALVRGFFEAIAEQFKKQRELRMRIFKGFISSIFHFG